MLRQLETTRGRPKIGKGGSSGWMAICTPASSATGTISRRKSRRLCAQPVGGEIAIAVQRRAKAFAVEDEFARRHPADQVLLPGARARFRSSPPGVSAPRRCGRPDGRSSASAPFQHQHVVGAEVDDVEAQRRAAMRHRIVEIGARPVGDRHEIVADGLHACRGDGPDGWFVIGDQLAEAAGARLDVLMNDDAFDDVPGEARPPRSRPCASSLRPAARLGRH